MSATERARLATALTRGLGVDEEGAVGAGEMGGADVVAGGAEVAVGDGRVVVGGGLDISDGTRTPIGVAT
jgi:hypothetical protein